MGGCTIMEADKDYLHDWIYLCEELRISSDTGSSIFKHNLKERKALWTKFYTYKVPSKATVNKAFETLDIESIDDYLRFIRKSNELSKQDCDIITNNCRNLDDVITVLLN